MVTAVKMDEETKSQVEELQAEIKLRTETKVTHQDIPARLVSSRLVESAVESRTAFVDSFRDSPEVLSADEVARFKQEMITSGARAVIYRTENRNRVQTERLAPA